MTDKKKKQEQLLLKVERLTASAKLPSRAYDNDAGFDLYADESVRINAHQRANIRTGIRVEIPEGYCLLIKDRGSTPGLGLTHAAGVVDQDYRGEVFLTVINFTSWPIDISTGDKLLQFLVVPVPKVTLKDVTSTGGISTSTSRGEKKLGSSNQN